MAGIVIASSRLEIAHAKSPAATQAGLPVEDSRTS